MAGDSILTPEGGEGELPDPATLPWAHVTPRMAGAVVASFEGLGEETRRKAAAAAVNQRARRYLGISREAFRWRLRAGTLPDHPAVEEIRALEAIAVGGDPFAPAGALQPWGRPLSELLTRKREGWGGSRAWETSEAADDVDLPPLDETPPAIAAPRPAPAPVGPVEAGSLLAPIPTAEEVEAQRAIAATLEEMAAKYEGAAIARGRAVVEAEEEDAIGEWFAGTTPPVAAPVAPAPAAPPAPPAGDDARSRAIAINTVLRTRGDAWNAWEVGKGRLPYPTRKEAIIATAKRGEAVERVREVAAIAENIVHAIRIINTNPNQPRRRSARPGAAGSVPRSRPRRSGPTVCARRARREPGSPRT